jgi:16S rRNA (cytosine1402-N4)-methyltransferase
VPSDNGHRPVLVTEVVAVLRRADVVVDATVGAGGHAAALLEAGVGTVVGIDRDPEAVAAAARRLARFGRRFRPSRRRFSDLRAAAADAGLDMVDGVLFDLGISSMQLDVAERGFSYRNAGPLDMRMGPDGPTAADVVNAYPEDRLADVIYRLGEERHSRRVAAAIVRARNRAPIENTAELSAIVAGAIPRSYRGRHPARRTFQAIRIEVNAELQELSASLPQATELLRPGGTLVVISYHSLEDRTVKRYLTGEPRLSVITRKPIRPSSAEAAANQRARSAKLRAATRVDAEREPATGTGHAWVGDVGQGRQGRAEAAA